MHQNIPMRGRVGGGFCSLSPLFLFSSSSFPSLLLLSILPPPATLSILTFILPFYLLFLISCPFPSLYSCLNSSALLLSRSCHLVSSLSLLLPLHLEAFQPLASSLSPLFFISTFLLFFNLSPVFRIYFTFSFLYLLHSSFFIFHLPSSYFLP